MEPNKSGQNAFKYPDWADLMEDKMINQAPGFWRIFGPLGPTAGPGNIGTGSRSRHTMQAMLHEASSTLHASCDRPRNPPGPAEEEHPLQTGHDAIGKEKQTGGRRQGTEKDLGPKSGDRRLGT